MNMTKLIRITVGSAAALFGLGILLVSCLIIAVNVSPKPFAWYISNGMGIEPVVPALYNDLRQSVRIEKNIEYPSQFKSNSLDIFAPVTAAAPFPTIIWVHGGAFVGGDKSDLETWATMIAAKGYTVVSINYELAPQRHYPGPVIQLGEVYEFLKNEAQRFPTVDLQRLIIGGDSAGAQIASQFVALQTNPVLAASMEMEALIPDGDLIAAILFCGPYDLVNLYDAESWFGRFFVRQLGWAYFGLRNWRDSPQASHASTIRNVVSGYPDTFITDGNTGSFEKDARSLEVALRKNGVYTDALYYPLEHGLVGHEYQFDFSLDESLEAYDRTLAFLEKVTTEDQNRARK
jgi:Esterase/lipase